jgi:amidophosphoribosyltransferase
MAIGLPKEEFCNACFTGKYPIPVQLQMDKLVFERSESEESLIPVGEGWDVDRRR